MATAAAKKQSKIAPTFAPSTREELEAKRDGVVAIGPSGSYYRVRAINLMRHALAGGLPQRVRELALQGTRGINRMLAAPDEEVDATGQTIRDYLDEIALAVVIEPELTKDDLGSGALDEQPLVHPLDYNWLVAIANGDEDRDGQGRLLWGREKIDRDAIFIKLYRAEHECDDDCEACANTALGFTEAVRAA